MSVRWSIEEFAARIGESPETVRDWQDRGLLGADPQRAFDHLDGERARIVRLILRGGVPVESLAESLGSGFMAHQLAEYLQRMFPGDDHPASTLEEAAAEVDLEVETARRIWTAAVPGAGGRMLGRGDVELLRHSRAALSNGFPETALLQMLRVWADATRRGGEVTSRMFHFYVHEDPLRNAAEEESMRLAERLEPLLEPLVLYFVHKGLAAAVPEDLVLHAREQAGLRGRESVPGRVEVAIAFVDLSQFTPLVDAMGDPQAAEILERFGDLVRDVAGCCDGRVIKQIGDAFMLAFVDPRSAVLCCLDIVERVATVPRFPAVRGGVHWGSALYREGDYVGASINVAARVADEADPQQVLVTGTVRAHLPPLGGIEIVRVGARQLKGIEQPVELFAARRGGPAVAARATDPVCGMQLGEAETAARLDLDGRTYRFCSTHCLRRFVNRSSSGP